MINQDLPVKIYIIKDPEDDYVFYVGQTTKTILGRFDDHMSKMNSNCRHKKPMLNYIKWMMNKGRKPLVEMVDQCSMELRFEREQEWIRYYVDKGYNLFNIKIRKEKFAVVKKMKIA